MPEVDLLTIERGRVIAPAGCGKTQLIAGALRRHSGLKPILILTHTVAGVVALRERLDRANVPSKAYRLSTIDGWAIRLVSLFPARTGRTLESLRVTDAKPAYTEIRAAAVALLKAGHISDVIAASYSRLIVDEYQDCSVRQHALVGYAAKSLPTCVLGDPLQAIFGFGDDPLPDWDKSVCQYFPLAGELSIPWRWINAGSEPLGRWLLEVRTRLLRGDTIDLSELPDAVTWVELDGTANDHRRCLAAASVHPPGGVGSVLIIGDSMRIESRHQIAGQIPGAVTVEAVDLRDLVAFGQHFDPAEADSLQVVIRFAQSVMTNVGADDLIRRVDALIGARAKKLPTDVEAAALAFVAAPSHASALDLLVEINRQAGVRAYRPAVLFACMKALRECRAGGPTFQEITVRVREQNRLAGRPLPKRAVGSTLLLKGLEAEVVVVLNAYELDRTNLYVAMTRGSKAITVCSRSKILSPA